MAKSRDAFRTISEVSDWLGAPAHVLRFWESRFKQIKPIKRAGGRRYYRPDDMFLLGGIRRLLHDDGLTKKGVQKVLREQGVKHVSSLCVETLDQTTMGKGPEGMPPSAAQGEPAAEFPNKTVSDKPDDTASLAAAALDTPRDVQDTDPLINQAEGAADTESLLENETESQTPSQRISELYSQLRSLRDRIRASMG